MLNFYKFLLKQFLIVLILLSRLNLKADEVTDVEWDGALLFITYYTESDGSRISCTVFNENNKPIAGGAAFAKGNVARVLTEPPKKYRQSKLTVKCKQ